MVNAQLAADAASLDAKLTELRTTLARLGREDLVRRIDDARLAGSTSLGIRYLLRAALSQVRSEIEAYNHAARLTDGMIALIARIVRIVRSNA